MTMDLDDRAVPVAPAPIVFEIVRENTEPTSPAEASTPTPGVTAMTMLYSLYTAEGIVFAADSQITAQGEARPRQSQTKVLRVPHLGAATEGGVIGFFGLAEVGRQTMTDWLRQVIAEPRRPADPYQFGEYLVGRLLHDASPVQLQYPSGFHIGAFAREDGLMLPVFRYASNIHGQNPDGSYTNIGAYSFDHQDHLARDFQAIPRPTLRKALRQRQNNFGFPHWYRNGDLGHFALLTNVVEAVIGHLVRADAYFESPDTLKGWEVLGRSLVVTVSQLHRAYHTEGPASIGGRPVALGVKWPV
jgi:hypothetical protein